MVADLSRLLALTTIPARTLNPVLAIAIGQIVEPIISAKSVAQLQWCGLLSTFVLNRCFDIPVHWHLGFGMFAPTRSRCYLKHDDLFSEADVLVGTQSPYHYQVIIGVEGENITIIEGNVPGIRIKTITRQIAQKRFRFTYRSWDGKDRRITV